MVTGIKTGPYCHISNDFDEVMTSTEVLDRESLEDISESMDFDINLIDEIEPTVSPRATTVLDRVVYRIKQVSCICAIRWYYTQAWCKEKMKMIFATLQRGARKA